MFQRVGAATEKDLDPILVSKLVLTHDMSHEAGHDLKMKRTELVFDQVDVTQE